MARDDVNREGLTFGEWVCAAGVAVFDYEYLRPYTESVRILPPSGQGGRGERVVSRPYSEKYRKAWRNGEDPTEYRALTGKQSPLKRAVTKPRVPAAQRHKIREFLASLDSRGLRRALWLLRRQDARPNEISPAAAQYDGLATTGYVRAEYRRRGWRVPKSTQGERVDPSYRGGRKKGSLFDL